MEARLSFSPLSARCCAAWLERNRRITPEEAFFFFFFFFFFPLSPGPKKASDFFFSLSAPLSPIQFGSMTGPRLFFFFSFPFPPLPEERRRHYFFFPFPPFFGLCLLVFRFATRPSAAGARNVFFWVGPGGCGEGQEGTQNSFFFFSFHLLDCSNQWQEARGQFFFLSRLHRRTDRWESIPFFPFLFPPLRAARRQISRNDTEPMTDPTPPTFLFFFFFFPSSLSSGLASVAVRSPGSLTLLPEQGSGPDQAPFFFFFSLFSSAVRRVNTAD